MFKLTDNALIALIFSTVATLAPNYGIGSVIYKQNYQPTQQGTNTAPTAYLHKISDALTGSPKVNYLVNGDGTISTTEYQQIETLFQWSALAIQDPANVNQQTAADILMALSAMMQGQKFIQIIEAQNVGILKITQIRNPNFVDDKGRNEYNPTFDFTLTHKQFYTMPAEQPIGTIKTDIYPI